METQDGMPAMTGATATDGTDGDMTHGTTHRDGTATLGIGTLGTGTPGIMDGDGAAAGIGIHGADLTARMAHGIRGTHGTALITRAGVRVLIRGDLGILSVRYGRCAAM